jgi:hypothetical protein
MLDFLVIRLRVRLLTQAGFQTTHPPSIVMNCASTKRTVCCTDVKRHSSRNCFRVIFRSMATVSFLVHMIGKLAITLADKGERSLTCSVSPVQIACACNDARRIQADSTIQAESQTWTPKKKFWGPNGLQSPYWGCFAVHLALKRVFG